MKKKGWLFLIPAVLLAVILAVFLRGQEEKPEHTLSGSMAGMTVLVTDAEGGTEELSCWVDETTGEGYFFLPNSQRLIGIFLKNFSSRPIFIHYVVNKKPHPVDKKPVPAEVGTGF